MPFPKKMKRLSVSERRNQRSRVLILLIVIVGSIGALSIVIISYFTKAVSVSDVSASNSETGVLVKYTLKNRTNKSLTEQVSALTKGQESLTEQVRALTEGQHRLTEGQQRLTEQVRALTEGQQRLTDTVGGLKGRMMEITYRDRAFAYFGTLLRRVRVIELHTLEDALEAALAPDEFQDILLLDLLLTGKLRHVPESPDILLAVEISSVVDRTDVSRAARRANLLRKAGYHAVPVVAGEEMRMIIGVPKEIKPSEYRVSMLPVGVELLTKAGHIVLVQTDAGLGSGIYDEDYLNAGAKLIDKPQKIFIESDLIVKVKEPLKEEYDFLRKGQVVFTYFHPYRNEYFVNFNNQNYLNF